MAALANGGTCSYNGTTFTSLYRSKMTTKPILDEARRTTIYVEHTLTIHGYVVAQTTDTTLDGLRRSLTACGGKLVFESKGFGTFSINVPGGTVRDARWGPVPEVMEWEPLGGDCNAARVVWRVTTWIPECPDARYQYALAAWNYEIDFAIDGDGYTTMHVSGYIEIPMTRITQTNRRLPDNVDRYREWLQTQVPLGFQRERQNYRVSKDKRRMDFSWQDVEVPLPLPEGSTKIDAQHDVESDLRRGFIQWGITISATITQARGLSKRSALDAFLLVLGSRLAGLTRRAGGPGGEPMLILDRFRAGESIFGRTSAFSASYRYFSRATIGLVLAACRLWEPIEGTDYQRWRSSLAALGVSGVRGWAGASNLPSDDAIIDLCLGADRSVVAIPEVRTKPPDPNKPAPGTKKDDPTKKLVPPGKVPAEESWVAYEIWLKVRKKTNVAPRKPLPQRPPPGSKGGPIPGDAAFVPAAPPGDIALATNDSGGGLKGTPFPTQAQGGGGGDWPKDSFQTVVSPTYTLTLFGYAIRAGYRVPVPTLTEVGGVPTVELDRTVVEGEVGKWGDHVIYYTAWEIEYRLPEAPRGPLPYLPRPDLHTRGGTDQGQG